MNNIHIYRKKEQGKYAAGCWVLLIAFGIKKKFNAVLSKNIHYKKTIFWKCLLVLMKKQKFYCHKVHFYKILQFFQFQI